MLARIRVYHTGHWYLCRAAEKFPNHGRIVVTQLSIGVGIPMTIILLKVHSSAPASTLCSITWANGVTLTSYPRLVCHV